jgi:hypothetical protein
MEKNGLPPKAEKSAGEAENATPVLGHDENEVMKAAEDQAEKIFLATPNKRVRNPNTSRKSDA